MNILLASESFVVRESLENLLKELTHDPQILSTSDLTKIDLEELIDLDFIFTDIKENCNNHISIIKEAKNYFKNLRVMILDSKNDKNIFEKAVQIGVEGYIIGFT